MSGFEDLKATVEELRAARFPSLPSSLVDTILETEAEHVEDRGPALRKVERAIDAFVSGPEVADVANRRADAR